MLCILLSVGEVLIHSTGSAQSHDILQMGCESSPLLATVFSGWGGHFEGEQQGGHLPGSEGQKQTDRGLHTHAKFTVCVSQERGKASVGLGLLDLAYCPTLKSYNILNWKDIFNIVRCVHSQTFMLTLYRSIDALNLGQVCPLTTPIKFEHKRIK